MTKWHWGFATALAVHGRASGSSCRSSLGAVALRVGGIAFAMVTLAFAQAGSVLALKNPHG